MVNGLRKKGKHAQAGFTLIEMCFVMFISSLMALGLMKYYITYRHAQAVSHTQEAISIVNSSIRQFQTTKFRLPCPANPKAQPGDADFGKEDCSAAEITVANAPGVDRDADGVEDQILIGAVPFADLFAERGMVPLTMADSLDGWSNKLTYAVTRKLTNLDTYNKEHGAINVIDEYAEPIRPESDVHYLLVSHGPNGVGAYTRDGGLVEPCTAIVLPPTLPPGVSTPATERENCDGDGTFIQGIRRDSEFARYDDFIRIFIMRDTDLWKVVGANIAVNTNVGNVAINLGGNVGAPEDKLHVMGDIQVSAALADQVCDEHGNFCMDVELLSGSVDQMRCPPNRAVKRIAGNRIDEHCVDYRPARAGLHCPTGQIMAGYNAITNTLRCVPRPM